MHKINKARLLAGLPIDASYERSTGNTSPVAKRNTTIEEDVKEAFAKGSNLSKSETVRLLAVLEQRTNELLKSLFEQMDDTLAFKKGQDVEDVHGNCYKVIKPVGYDSDDNVVFLLVCPETGEMVKMSEIHLRVCAPESHVKENVAQESNIETVTPEENRVEEASAVKVDTINFDNDETQPKTPAVVTPQPQKTKVPNHILNDLKAARDAIEGDVKLLKGRDQANAVFHQQIVDVMNKLEDLMVNDIKQAQIFLSSLMGPILHKIPSSVCKFVYSGGDKSLKSYFNK